MGNRSLVQNTSTPPANIRQNPPNNPHQNPPHLTKLPTRTQTLLHLVGLRSSRRTNIILVLPQQYHAQHDDERTTEIAYPRPSCILTPFRPWKRGGVCGVFGGACRKGGDSGVVGPAL